MVAAANCNVVLLVDQRVEHMQRLARGRGDQLGEVRPIAARKVGVDFEPGSQAVMSIETAGVTAEPGCLEKLPIGR